MSVHILQTKGSSQSCYSLSCNLWCSLTWTLKEEPPPRRHEYPAKTAPSLKRSAVSRTNSEKRCLFSCCSIFHELHISHNVFCFCLTEFCLVNFLYFSHMRIHVLAKFGGGLVLSLRREALCLHVSCFQLQRNEDPGVCLCVCACYICVKTGCWKKGRRELRSRPSQDTDILMRYKHTHSGRFKHTLSC